MFLSSLESLCYLLMVHFRGLFCSAMEMQGQQETCKVCVGEMWATGK